jgi:hypothetical protein
MTPNIIIMLLITIGNGKDIYVAPFVDIKAFWEEYCAFHTLQHTPSSNVAGITTFRQAYKFCEGLGIRKLKSKGTFNTCEICNNASDLLRNTSKKKYIIYFSKLMLVNNGF